MSISSMFGHFFICTLIDAMGQVLWVMAFIRPTSMYFAAGAPGGPFPFTDQDQKKLLFPNFLHQTAVGVTFSYAKPLCIIQKFGPAQMSKWDTSICCYETRPRNRKTLFILGFVEKMLNPGTSGQQNAANYSYGILLHRRKTDVWLLSMSLFLEKWRGHQ